MSINPIPPAKKPMVAPPAPMSEAFGTANPVPEDATAARWYTKDPVTVEDQEYACISVVAPEDTTQKGAVTALKIRGVFATADEAKNYARKLQQADDTFDIYVVNMYRWLPLPPPKTLPESHYADAQLENLMVGYEASQAAGKAAFEQRKAESLRQAAIELEKNKAIAKAEAAAEAAGTITEVTDEAGPSK